MSFYLGTHFTAVDMLGDSIIAQMAPRQSGFQAPFNIATNLGNSGDTVAQITARVGSITSTSTHVILEGGVNDLLGLGTDGNIIAGYTTMLNTISSAKKVIVIGILPIDETTIRQDWLGYLSNAKIHQMNVEISQLCLKYSNCVPATSVMTKNMSGKTADGIHPLASADTEIINLLMPLLGL